MTDTMLPPGTRLVLVAEDADHLFFGRDDAGNRLTFEWGQPDEHGWYTPTITAHYDDNLRSDVRDEVAERFLAAVLERPRTFALAVRVTDWGSSVSLVSGGAGGTKPSTVENVEKTSSTASNGRPISRADVHIAQVAIHRSDTVRARVIPKFGDKGLSRNRDRLRSLALLRQPKTGGAS